MNTTSENLLRGLLGMFFLVLVCWVLSNNRRAISWKLVVLGIVAQVMFAMGVLHTMAFGQPVFWMFFGLILLYTIIRKLSKATNGETPVTHQPLDLGLSILWQVVFVAGLIFLPQFFSSLSGPAMTINRFSTFIISFYIGNM